MPLPSRCPNPTCTNHLNPDPHWYRPYGWYQTAAHGPVRRFRCRGGTFARQARSRQLMRRPLLVLAGLLALAAGVPLLFDAPAEPLSPLPSLPSNNLGEVMRDWPEVVEGSARWARLPGSSRRGPLEDGLDDLVRGHAVRLPLEGEQDAVAEAGHRDGAHVLSGHGEAAGTEGLHLGGQDQRLRAARQSKAA